MCSCARARSRFEQAKAVTQRASVHTDKELGLLLIHNGFLSQNDILAGVRTHL